MEFPLSLLCAAFCFGLALCWLPMAGYANEMGGFSGKKVKLPLSFLCSASCFGFALCWLAVAGYAKGMGSFSGNYPWSLFSKVWVVIPVIFAITGAVAVWLPLSTAAKTALLRSLMVLGLVASLIDNTTPLSKPTFQNKIPVLLLGSIPILFPFVTWAVDRLLSKKYDSGLAPSNVSG